MALEQREMAILDFERIWWTLDAPKDALIRERFDCDANEYYQELNQVLQRSEALAYDPMVVRRLHRLRDRRRRARLESGAAAGSEGTKP